LPVDIARLGQSDGTVIAIVNHFGGPLIRPWLDEVDAQPSRRADHVRTVCAKSAKLTEECVRYRVVWRQDGDISGWVSECSQRHRDIRLSTTEARAELWRLEKALETRGLEAE